MSGRRPFVLRGRFWVGMLPWAWLLLFFLLPFALIVNVSLSTADLAIPPYVSPLHATEDGSGFELVPDLSSFRRLADELGAIGEDGADLLYLQAYGNSLLLATLTTLCCLLIGYPFAYHIALSR